MTPRDDRNEFRNSLHLSHNSVLSWDKVVRSFLAKDSENLHELTEFTRTNMKQYRMKVLRDRPLSRLATRC